MDPFTFRLFSTFFLTLGLLKFGFDAPGIFKNIIGSVDDALKGKFNGLSAFNELKSNAKKVGSTVKKYGDSAKKFGENVGKTGRGAVGAAVGFNAGAKTGGFKGALRGMVKGSRAAKETKPSWLEGVGMGDVVDSARKAGAQIGSRYMNPHATKLIDAKNKYGQTVNSIYTDTKSITDKVDKKKKLETQRDTQAATISGENYNTYLAQSKGITSGGNYTNYVAQGQNASSSPEAQQKWNATVQSKKSQDLANAISAKERELGRSLTDTERNGLVAANDSKWSTLTASGDIDEIARNMNGVDRETFNSQIESRKHADFARELAKKEKELGHSISAGDAEYVELQNKNDNKWGKADLTGEWRACDASGAITADVMSDESLSKMMADVDAQNFSDTYKAEIDKLDKEISEERANLLDSEYVRERLVSDTDDMLKEQAAANRDSEVAAAYEAAVKEAMKKFDKNKEGENLRDVATSLGVADADKASSDYDKMKEVYEKLKTKELSSMNNEEKRALKAIVDQINKVTDNTQSSFNRRQSLYNSADKK